MPESLYPQPSKDPARTRRDLAPEIEEAFQQFSKECSGRVPMSPECGRGCLLLSRRRHVATARHRRLQLQHGDGEIADMMVVTAASALVCHFQLVEIADSACFPAQGWSAEGALSIGTEAGPNRHARGTPPEAA